MRYYPDQLRSLADLCEAMDKTIQAENNTVSIASRIKVHHPDDENEILGYLVDEIGGVWCFEPQKGGE